MTMKVFTPCDILLPKTGVDMTKWAVVACDQHSSDKVYWNDVANTVGQSPSTRSLILPECDLSPDNSREIEAIHAAMQQYDGEGIFETYENAYIYLERTQSDGRVRKGIVGAVDLAAYDYHKGAKTPIRASEATVTERIPPRVRIRKNALLELPHVMLLTDDKDKTVIEPLSEHKAAFTLLYDFDLMAGGGHVRGYLIDKDSALQIDTALSALQATSPFLFAVGDGNHSLATAKAVYEEAPTPLSRYALCEIVNIHDEALTFEPIYRVLFGVEKKELITALMTALPPCDETTTHTFTVLSAGQSEQLTTAALHTLAVTDLQNFLDDYVKAHPTVTIDYIHGKAETVSLCQGPNTVGFLFEGMKKEELFPTVAKDGALVRKTFSMGEAADKRYYIEGRKIK